jgi:hypothetical protein
MDLRVETIEHNHAMTAFHQEIYRMRANKSGAASYHYFHEFSR